MYSVIVRALNSNLVIEDRLRRAITGLALTDVVERGCVPIIGDQTDSSFG